MFSWKKTIIDGICSYRADYFVASYHVNVHVWTHLFSVSSLLNSEVSSSEEGEDKLEDKLDDKGELGLLEEDPEVHLDPTNRATLLNALPR